MSDVLFHILRHGETNLNDYNDYRGWLNDDSAQLNDLGRKAAEEAAEYIKRYKIPVNVIICSDLDRAKETAQIVAAILGVTVIAEDANWRTLNVGDAEGKPKSEYPIKKYFDDKLLKFPNGESLIELENRTIQAASDALEIVGTEANVLVVTHGTNAGFIWGMQNEGKHIADHYEGPVKPGGLIQVMTDSAIPLTLSKDTFEMNKIDQAAAVYLPARMLPKRGTHCGECWKFIKTGACIEVKGKIEAEKTCTQYIKGQPFPIDPKLNVVQITQSIAGYGKGDTHCETCEYFGGLDKCKKVHGYDGEENKEHIEAGGCCNLHEEKH